uniref:Uncharacterized protein n=1 Tax=Trypanosoma congolense (strain IL3000) TaxID=1068625 RepID=G0UW12_TRYCI|nr:conserved hypothetical protein [Trypanosoma congolense IL3000]
MPQSGEVISNEELCLLNDAQALRWCRTEGVHGTVDHNGVFSLADYDYPDPHFLRSFCTAPVIPWESFQAVRKGRVVLSEAHERAVAEDLVRLSVEFSNGGSNNSSSNSSGSGLGGIALPVKSIGKFLEDVLPGLCAKKGDSLYRGATFLLLGILTGSILLARWCLALGSDPNDMSFLSDSDVVVNQMQHGYSPMFVAVITGNIEMMELLSRFGGSVAVYDRWGRTPLHAALAMADRETISWLQDKGAPRWMGNSGLMLHDMAKYPDLAPVNFALNPRPQLSSSSQVIPSVSEAPEAGDEGGEMVKGDMCHCHSGRPKCFCGCVDDMFLRWSYDRLQSRWHSGLNFSGMAAAPAKRQQAPPGLSANSA